MTDQNNKLKKLNNFVIFKTDKGKVSIEVFFKDDTLWLTQKLMAELFDVDRSVITKHIANIFTEGELYEKSVSAKFAHTASDGKTYQTQFYNLDVIIAVGYRVNSHRATNFRIWATKLLREFIVKGFVLDDKRLKQMKHFGEDYFSELLERIREIRVSERRLYQKITDIYALSADYDKNHPMTKGFFSTVQNKLHWAIVGQTAAEIIYNESDAKKINMGLKTWENAPDGKILKTDVSTAKNYLNEQHIKELERIISAFLDLAENRAQRGIVMNMKKWVKFLNKFLELSDYPILTHKGKISALEAKIKAEGEYDKFRVEQDRYFESDFDKQAKKYLKQGKKKKKEK
ncbi:MAG: virulence RhuM family protein [Elusimicrobia bacterium]|jgi:hypothetical protein|nr:virulence RhuM family protein [Elusimicrobiota bacterium]